MTNVEEIKLTNYKEVYCFCDSDVFYILISLEFLETRFNKAQARKKIVLLSCAFLSIPTVIKK